MRNNSLSLTAVNNPLLPRVCSLLILGVVITQSLNSLLTVAAFELNKEYISKNLCENRDKPQMHCNGKCHLVKQQEKSERSPIAPVKEKQEVVQFFESNRGALPYFMTGIQRNIIPYIDGESQSVMRSVFHPPAA